MGAVVPQVISKGVKRSVFPCVEASDITPQLCPISSITTLKRRLVSKVSYIHIYLSFDNFVETTVRGLTEGSQTDNKPTNSLIKDQKV